MFARNLKTNQYRNGLIDSENNAYNNNEDILTLSALKFSFY